MQGINLHRLQIFRTVFELSNISSAARKINLAQPTISKHLAIFEDELGIKLFTNNAGRIEPTWEAQRLYAETGKLFERVAQVDQTVDSIRRGADESLRIMSIMTLSMSIIPDAVGELYNKLPSLDIALEGGGAIAQLLALRSGTTDVAVGGLLPPSPDLRQQSFGKCRLVAAIPNGHPLAKEREINLDMLGQFECILPNPKAPLGQKFYETISRHGVTPKRTISAHSLVFAVGLAKTTGRYTIVDELTARDFATEGLVCRPITPTIEVKLATIELAGAPRRNSVAVFQKALARVFARHMKP